MIRPDSKFAHRTNDNEKQSRLGGSDSKFVPNIGNSSDGNTFGKADNKHKPQLKTPTMDTRTGRSDRGKPLYHGGINPGDNSYDNSEIESDNSLDITNQPNFKKP